MGKYVHDILVAVCD